GDARGPQADRRRAPRRPPLLRGGAGSAAEGPPGRRGPHGRRTRRPDAAFTPGPPATLGRSPRGPLPRPPRTTPTGRPRGDEVRGAPVPVELRAAAKGEPLATCEALIAQLSAIRDDMIRAAEGSADLLAGLHPRHRASGRNLLHYLAFRRHDLRPPQEALSRLGLSSLGRAEAHVLASVDAVLGGLHRIAGRPVPPEAPTASDFEEGPRRLRANAEALFGPPRPERGTRIMVTLPGDAAADCTLVYDLLRAGTDCVRVNCAHDDPAAWGRMIGHLRRAEEATGRPCRLLMDLAGPKL